MRRGYGGYVFAAVWHTLTAGKHPADPQQRASARAAVTRVSISAADASLSLLQPDTLLQYDVVLVAARIRLVVWPACDIAI